MALRTLPASWYRSSPLYQLEQRSVFAKAWYLLGPLVKFSDEPVVYEIAQYEIEARKKDGLVTVVDPKTKKPVKHHITKTGLLFSTVTDEAPSFDEYFPGLEDLLASVQFKLPYRHGISYDGKFNWKAMVDGYQECLHCAYTHPSFSVLYPSTSYQVTNYKNYCKHVTDPSKPDDGLFLFFFPICTLNLYGGGMSCFRVCPVSPGVTRMEFDYYHREDGEAFNKYFKFVRQVALEDYELCESAQENLQRGVYSEGILHPERENGVIYYQERVFEMVMEGFKNLRN
ncbi:hypothetical protein ASPZODRAFT_136386 [Penicilliopsis zonata CBS 506.65]|uniref:Choline monooxygenase, chloroplastic n=1 Tax=Penicilliopsis zonata CBS 506.65 TaxID=1073090 RepID=A0A1L9S7T0_9EURO|nr:hypothetical protein ASPZODRAFT_136386 [Penicilliopsis zonata CBS 506.65]OJJ43194.1 hypothetical protein ASPZODRAFT_136386 [Penicilliopsis zonata CBS 506.65]